MELNEIHTDQEQATVSTKVLLLIFAIVLTGVLGYLVWQQNNAADTTDNSDVVVKKTTAVSTANWKTYTNTKYNFTAKYPPTWTVETINTNPTHPGERHFDAGILDRILFCDDGTDNVCNPSVYVTTKLDPSLDSVFKLVSQTDTTFAGTPATKYCYNSIGTSVPEICSYSFTVGNIYYLVEGGYLLRNDSNSKIWDEIENTFKLTK